MNTPKAATARMDAERQVTPEMITPPLVVLVAAIGVDNRNSEPVMEDPCWTGSLLSQSSEYFRVLAEAIDEL